MKLKKRNRKATQGQAMVEYLVLMAIVVAISGPLVKQLIGMIDSSLGKTSLVLEKRLSTGRLSNARWQ